MLNFGDGMGREKWTCYQFTLNVCQIFSQTLLERLKTVIDELPDPAGQMLESANIDDLSVPNSQDDASRTPESGDESIKKPLRPSVLLAEERTRNQKLQRQLEQQSKDEAKKEMLLIAQLEQQRMASEQQNRELLQVLKQQSELITKLTATQS